MGHPDHAFAEIAAETPDPDADFSYDYADLDFQRTGPCE